MEPMILLFDGTCGLCDALARFVCARDGGKKFMFAALQSESGRRLAERHKISSEELRTMALIEGERCYRRSSAALRVARELGGTWKAAYALIIIPAPLRDAAYNWISSNRYRWFGQHECRRVLEGVPAERFLL